MQKPCDFGKVLKQRRKISYSDLNPCWYRVLLLYLLRLKTNFIAYIVLALNLIDFLKHKKTQINDFSFKN